MNNERTSRNFFAVVLVTLAAMGATGSQCARVDDSATGPNSDFLDASGTVTGCIQECNDGARGARQAENDRFHEALRNCDSGQCRQEEARDHQANLEQINTDQGACKSGCHEQGRGSGGQ